MGIRPWYLIRKYTMFKRIWIKLLLFPLILIISIVKADAKRVRVKGYYRKDGTYVKPHSRIYGRLLDLIFKF